MHYFIIFSTFYDTSVMFCEWNIGLMYNNANCVYVNRGWLWSCLLVVTQVVFNEQNHRRNKCLSFDEIKSNQKRIFTNLDLANNIILYLKFILDIYFCDKGFIYIPTNTILNLKLFWMRGGLGTCFYDNGKLFWIKVALNEKCWFWNISFLCLKFYILHITSSVWNWECCSTFLVNDQR